VKFIRDTQKTLRNNVTFLRDCDWVIYLSEHQKACDKIGVTRHIGKFCENTPLKPLPENSFTYLYSEYQVVWNVALLSRKANWLDLDHETVACGAFEPSLAFLGADGRVALSNLLLPSKTRPPLQAKL